jgi:uncharacterized protein
MTDPNGRPTASLPTYRVRVAWDARIPVRDGIALSANIWIPVGEPAEPPKHTEPPVHAQPEARFPAILEMIPYGKDNWRRNADTSRGEWLAARGYALCRVDVRGTGSSEGVALDEYTADETQDGYEAVEWLAAQPWCDGNVGMWGISYGGFTAIQVAALRPPHLRAIVPVMATDDRYRADVHYVGGCLTASEQSQYAVSQVAMNAMPPDPGFRGEGWREEWLARLEATPAWTLEWLRRQHDGPYWRVGSLAPDYDRIEAAILGIGGWMDSYVDPAFRMQERCSAAAERRLIVGAWGHGLPDSAEPGPPFDWLPELVRFLDRHLRGVDDELDGERPVAWFQREWTEPARFPVELNGRWLSADAFPVPGTTSLTWQLAGGSGPMVGRLETLGSAVSAGVDHVAHRPTLGTAAALSWGAGGAPNGMGGDLRRDESLSLTYTSDALTEPLDVLGVPAVVLHLSADAPIATVVVRLTDVAPDGTSAQVSAGLLNLTHRRSDEHPEPLAPGRVEEVRVPLRTAGYRWLPGHRLRVSVATQYWPVIWPSPLSVTLSVHRGPGTPSRLELPVLPQSVVGGLLSAYLPTDDPGPPADLRDVGGGTDEPPRWRIEEDVIGRSVTVHVEEWGTVDLEDGRSLYSGERLAMTAWDDGPGRARLHSDVVYRWREHTFETEIRAIGETTSDATTFFFDLRLEVDLDAERFFERTWHETIPRRLV